MSTMLRSFWVLQYRLNGDAVMLTVGAVMTHSMLDALTRSLCMPLKFYDLTEHSDMAWTAFDKMEVGGHKTKIVVLMQDEQPIEDILNWPGAKIIVDNRDPDLLESAKRAAGGFRRMPASIKF